jgi:hypothetical protein
MNGVLSWLLALLIAVLIVGLVGYARGPAHHHGDDVGSHPAVTLTVGL